MKTILNLVLLLTISCAFAQSDEKFYTPSKNLKPFEIQNHEAVLIIVETDTLHNVFFKPAGKAKATILFFQGAGGNFSDYQYITKPFVEAGYQVLMTSFRGYGKSTGKPTHLNIASDAEVIFETFTKRKDVKNLPVLVYGTSIGCQVAVNLTRKKQSKIKALILDSGFTSFTDIALSTTPETQHAMIRQYVVSPYSAEEDIKAIKNVKILVIQSEQDEFVPFALGKKVFDNANEPKTIYQYEGKHIEAMKTDPKKIISKIDGLL